jgi:choline dehydrogenase-like flavoprotein
MHDNPYLREQCDAVVIGSGATGGLAAKLLTEAGFQVALVEAGRTTSRRLLATTPNAKGNPFVPKPIDERLLKRQSIQASCYACREPFNEWFVDDVDYPYNQVHPFYWIRMRGVGGRLLAWEGQCYRMSDLDFKAHSHDGYGDDWPISYADLKPYYDMVERYLKVTGTKEDLNQVPDGRFESSSDPNDTLAILKEPLKNLLQRDVIPARLAHETCDADAVKRIRVATVRTPTGLQNVHSYWPAITDAISTGRLFLIPRAVAVRINVKGDHASHVVYVDATSGKWYELKTRLVVLCASTLESTRLLLNSGICNSSGVLGHYLMDHIRCGGASGLITDRPWAAGRCGHQQHRIYIPRFRNLTSKRMKAFIRGYGFQGRSFLWMNGTGPPGGLCEGLENSVGYQMIQLAAFCECLARFDNHVTIDPNKRDALGIPTLSISMRWCGNEIALTEDAVAEACRMLMIAGLNSVKPARWRSVPGHCIHEVGTARMGDDHRKSVVNEYCQTHDVPNMFVTDGSCWVSSGCQNPTLTMMAITARACDYIRHKRSRGEL